MIGLCLLLLIAVCQANGQSCDPGQWVPYVDMVNEVNGVQDSGTVQTALTTVADCQAGCEANVDCTSFSFTPALTFLNCYFHSDNIDNTRTSNPGRTYYQFETVCTYRDGTKCTFVYVGQYTFTADLTSPSSITSEAECQLECINQGNCLSSAFLLGGMPECILSATASNYLNGRTRENRRRQHIKDTTRCIATEVVTQSPKPTCPYGSPLAGVNCGKGGVTCPAGFLCNIHPADAYAVCCPCRESPNYHGPCSKTCGIGQWGYYDGCGNLIRTEKCCVEPCKPIIGTTPSSTPTPGKQDLCRFYRPYGGK